jgi:MtN3 and saliva related transmembrane protein
MYMRFDDVVGFIAGVLTTSALIPQFLKSLRTRSTKDVSLWMLVIFCAGLFLWLIYGIMIHVLPIIIFNALSFVLALSMLILKYVHR